jgi:hypothetical protein
MSAVVVVVFLAGVISYGLTMTGLTDSDARTICPYSEGSHAN